MLTSELIEELQNKLDLWGDLPVRVALSQDDEALRDIIDMPGDYEPGTSSPRAYVLVISEKPYYFVDPDKDDGIPF